VVWQARLPFQQELAALDNLPRLVRRRIVCGDQPYLAVVDDLGSATVLEVTQRDSIDAGAALAYQRDTAAELYDPFVADVDAVMMIKPTPHLKMVAGLKSAHAVRGYLEGHRQQGRLPGARAIDVGHRDRTVLTHLLTAALDGPGLVRNEKLSEQG